MVVKFKCKCGTSKIIKVDNLKKARNIKKENKNYICNVCEFKIILRNVAKQIVKENKRYA